MDERAADGATYEAYVGRWSRVAADAFVAWLDVPPGAVWLDAACGAGALTRCILARAAPTRIDASDANAAYVGHARALTADPRATFAEADARALPFPDDAYDAAVAGLPFPATPDPSRVLAELRRVAKRDGVVATYVWDFDGEMQMLRIFWDVARALDPGADWGDQDDDLVICKPGPLGDAFAAAGLRDVDVRAIDAPARFVDFDDYWLPFTRGRAPAQRYVQSLAEEPRVALRERLRATLPVAADGSIALVARAWAARGLA